MLGQPQTEEEMQEKTYGKFRMGRGQIFAMGHNTWRTNEFEMAIDIHDPSFYSDAGEILYALKDDLPKHLGCAIRVKLNREWREQLTLREIHRVETELRRQVKYMPIRVLFNGSSLTLSQDGIRWDEEHALFKFKFKEDSPLTIYNEGAYVCEIPYYKHGVGGILISQTRMEVNFARNDILTASCPVWKAAKSVFRKYAERRTEESNRVTDEDISHSLYEGMADPSALGAAWVRLITGHKIKVADLDHKVSAGGGLFGFAKKGDKPAVAAHQQGLVCVLQQDVLYGADLDMDEVGKAIEKFLHEQWRDSPWRRGECTFKYIPVPDLRDITHSGEFTVLGTKNLGKHAKVRLLILRNVLNRLNWELRNICDELGEEAYHPKVLVPVTADATMDEMFTDGKRAVYVKETTLSQGTYSLKELSRLILVLCDNTACREDNHASAKNDPEHLERQLKLRYCLGECLQRVVVNIPKWMKQQGLDIKPVLTTLDQILALGDPDFDVADLGNPSLDEDPTPGDSLSSGEEPLDD